MRPKKKNPFIHVYVSWSPGRDQHQTRQPNTDVRVNSRLQYSRSSIDVSEVCRFWRLLTLTLPDELARTGLKDLSYSQEEKKQCSKCAEGLQCLLHFKTTLSWKTSDLMVSSPREWFMQSQPKPNLTLTPTPDLHWPYPNLAEQRPQTKPHLYPYINSNPTAHLTLTQPNPTLSITP